MAAFDGMTETFVLRDDRAECQDCTWQDEWSEGRRTNVLGTEARKHAQREGHQVVVKRVQFIRHTGRRPAAVGAGA